MIFLHALKNGSTTPDEWARHAWEHLKQSNPAALRAGAAAFTRLRLPVLRALGIA
jgi:hypothetical protein